MKFCGSCKHYEPYMGVCCNGASAHRADIMDADDVCVDWEEIEDTPEEEN